MDSSPKNLSNPPTNNHNTSPITDMASQRPFKVQKINGMQNPPPSSSLNIPAFMGPIPTIQHHESVSYTHYSPNNLQNEGNSDQSPDKGQDSTYHQQEQQRSQQETPRRYQTTSPNNTTPNRANTDPFCMYKEEDVTDGISNCNNSLIGKILSTKIILKPVLLSTLQGIWGNPKGLNITEIEGGFFHITMELEKDTQRALQGNPWMVRNSWFMVHLWDRQINPNNLDFHHVPAWIQIWGLPIHCKTVNMGKYIGSQLGKVEDAAIYDYPQKSRIVKIRVCINSAEPIKAGMYIGNTRDGINWVDFRYENLPMFCFNCGLVGHNEDKCDYPTQIIPEGGMNNRGPWLRSNIYGKRVHENRD
ncbi:zinc ion binding / nucleic acid binding protein [Trifolium repens]|nr:zinc ion binding / nucleic acid binding protein [Trifolium repens]